MTTRPVQGRMTLAEYFERELTAQERHEYREGDVVMMSGGLPEHSLIIANTISALGLRLRGRPCRVYDSNLRIRIPRHAVYTYPDISVVCGERQPDPDDPTGQSVTNPRLIVEVLSPTTEAYDRGEKFRRYLQIDSLQEYLLVSTATCRVETFYLSANGQWLFSYWDGLDSTVELRSLELSLPLSEIYAGVNPPA